MDEEPAINRRSIRKRAKFADKCAAAGETATPIERTGIASLPTEILLEIVSYLFYGDLCALRCVSRFFHGLLSNPYLWHDYEVTNNGVGTSDVIGKLKGMPFLRKFTMRYRTDSDDILRQLSLSNKSLEELRVSDCTGSTSKLYLRSGHLIRILRRCRRLHTIEISGIQFRGQKFYELLGDMGLRLRAATTMATSLQYHTFVRHAPHIREKDREEICAAYTGTISWAPLHYFVMELPNGARFAAIRFANGFVSIGIPDGTARRVSCIVERHGQHDR